MKDALNALYDTVMARKKNPTDGSYTCYLFEQGLDKILKKCGEECAETIIAAKNADNPETVLEIADLLYHLVVLMAQQGITPLEIEAELEKRSQKIGNLKQKHSSNPNS